MIQAVSSLITTVSDIFASKAQSEAFDKAVREQRAAELAAQEQRIRTMAVARAQQALDIAHEESVRRRQQQLTTLYAVGGIALIVSGAFIYSTMKRK